MNPTRLRTALCALRWSPETLVSALAIKPEQVLAWLDGSKRVPADVAGWLEGLAAAHEANPHPEGGSNDRSARQRLASSSHASP
jgi:hypothetical protein